MTKKKKILIIVLVLVLAITATLVSLWAFVGYTFYEGDFLIELSADRTEVRVGETVTVTATVTNVSGRNIRVRHSNPNAQELWVGLAVVTSYEYPNHSFAITMEGGWFRNSVIRRGESLQNTRDVLITEDMDYIAKAIFVFRDNRGFFTGFNPGAPHWLRPENVIISVN